jgi:hypothetical protein
MDQYGSPHSLTSRNCRAAAEAFLKNPTQNARQILLGYMVFEVQSATFPLTMRNNKDEVKSQKDSPDPDAAKRACQTMSLQLP